MTTALYARRYSNFSSAQLVPTDGSTNPGVLGLPGPTDTTYGFTPGDRLQVYHAITEPDRQMETVKNDTARAVAGRLRFHEVNNYTFKYHQSIAPGEETKSRLGGTYDPRWNNSFRTAYEFDLHEIGLTARTAASTLNITDPTYTQDAAVTNARIPSYTVWDLNYSLKASRQLSVNVGVNNVFDRAMAYSSSVYNDTYVQGLNDVVGRYAYINAHYAFRPSGCCKEKSLPGANRKGFLCLHNHELPGYSVTRRPT